MRVLEIFVRGELHFKHEKGKILRVEIAQPYPHHAAARHTKIHFGRRATRSNAAAAACCASAAAAGHLQRRPPRALAVQQCCDREGIIQSQYISRAHALERLPAIINIKY